MLMWKRLNYELAMMRRGNYLDELCKISFQVNNRLSCGCVFVSRCRAHARVDDAATTTVPPTSGQETQLRSSRAPPVAPTVAPPPSGQQTPSTATVSSSFSTSAARVVASSSRARSRPYSRRYPNSQLPPRITSSLWQEAFRQFFEARTMAMPLNVLELATLASILFNQPGLTLSEDSVRDIQMRFQRAHARYRRENRRGN